MAPKEERSDVSKSSMPKGSHKVLPVSQKVKVIDLIRKEKKSYAEVAKIYVRTNLCAKLFRREKKFIPVFQSHFKLQVLATVCGKCLVKSLVLAAVSGAPRLGDCCICSLNPHKNPPTMGTLYIGNSLRGLTDIRR